MVKYESRESLHTLLKVLKNPQMHYSISFGWVMSEFMFVIVKEEIQKKLQERIS
jgi:hypothetical protein